MMGRARLLKVTEAGYVITGAYDDTIEAVAHEVAHSILLFGCVRVRSQVDVEERIRSMPLDRADRHEIKACALEVAGLRALGFRLGVRRVAVLALGAFSGRPRRTLHDVDAVAAAIRAERPSARNIERFVNAYKHFERWV